MKKHIAAAIVTVAFVAGGLAGCQDSTSSCPNTGTATASIQQCVNMIGWQFDFILDADMNGLLVEEDHPCVDAMISQWYEENPATSEFTAVVAWHIPPDCGPRTPFPGLDDVVCTIHGTHAWSEISGFSPAERMALDETVTAVTGDYDADGTEDQCGPLSILVGTTRNLVVAMTDTCASGGKLSMWEPEVDEREATPPLMFDDAAGIAWPMVLCTNPGALEPSDHLTGRKICAFSRTIQDVDT